MVELLAFIIIVLIVINVVGQFSIANEQKRKMQIRAERKAKLVSVPKRTSQEEREYKEKYRHLENLKYEIDQDS